MNINFNQFTKKICVESLVTWSLFSILIPPTYSESLVLWVSTLATCQAHRVRSIYLASFFFFTYENQSDAAADCREEQDVLSTSGLKGNN